MPTTLEVAAARASVERLSPYRGRALSIRVNDQEQPVELPAGAAALLIDILDAMAAGSAVAIVRESAELTTVQAASILNVSRPYLIKLLSEGAIPHRKLGKHRRIRIEDVMNYKNCIDRQREAVLDQLAADAQQSNTGYVNS